MKKKSILRQDVPVLEVSPERGLTRAQALERKEKGWTNGQNVSAGRTEWEIIARNLFTFFNLVFVVMAVALALAGSSLKNMTFMIVVVCNLCIGIFQEIRAKRAVDQLKLVAAQKLPVLREGEIIVLPSEELVRDDIVEFTVGDQICADGQLLTGSLQVNEALITGEEDPITKMPGDRLLSGSFVISGKGRVRLTEVGADCFVSRLTREAKKDPGAASSEMMTALDKLIRYVGVILIPVGVALFCQDFYGKTLGLTASAEKTVAALVGMIPEGLYLLTSVAMAASALKLTRDKVLVKDLNCIESLARVDVLCVDKTGTITEPGMEVEQVVPLADNVDVDGIFRAFYHDFDPENDTAKALFQHFSGETDWVCQQRIPFTSQTKWSAAVFEKQGIFVTGAPEFVMGAEYETIRETVERWSDTGSRVLLLAKAGRLSQRPEDLQPLALVLLSNRIRAAAKQTFAYFRAQGVHIKVISGDNPLTVSRVALRAGIVGAEHYVDMSALHTEEEIAAVAEKCTVFGRVTPDQKRALLRALKQAGHTVAMTGDGVNDVLALKEADCSIAMASGAQAANQIAQMVLLNSDFAAMPAIVGEGRRVINNIQRAASLFLVKNILSLGLSMACLLTGQSYPFAPFHLTMISALTIGVPSFFLAMEPNYERVSGKFLPTVLGRALPGGLTNLILVLLAQLLLPLWGVSQALVTTTSVGILAVTGMSVLYRTCRPFGWFRRLLWWAMGMGLVLCFTLLHNLFDLPYGPWQELPFMLGFLLAAPVAFAALCRIFLQKRKNVAGDQ